MNSRLVWKIVGTVLAVPLLLFAATQTALALAHSQRTESANVPADDLTGVNVVNSAGNVRIIGVEGATSVRVRARIDDGFRHSGHSVTTEDGILEVHGSCPNYGSTWCNVKYTIEVPHTLPVSGGPGHRIEVTDLTARVKMA